MADKEPITAKKFFSGIASPQNFLKLGAHAINIGIVILVIFGALSIWNYFFPKKVTQVQTQNSSSSVVFQKESGVEKVTIVNKQDQQQKSEDTKKTVGLELSGSSEDAGLGFVKYFNDKLAVVVGVRWKYHTSGDEKGVLPEIKLRYDF